MNFNNFSCLTFRAQNVSIPPDQNIFHGAKFLNTPKLYTTVTFKLNGGTYKPYHKPDNNITYITAQSNHPPNIIKQLQKAIEKQLSNNSSNEIIFNEAKLLYEKALSEAGSNVKLECNPNKKTKQNIRKRNIIWFSQPDNKNVVTKVDHYFTFF